MVSKHIVQSVEHYIPISDRVILAKFNSKRFFTNVIQVYAPTLSSDKDELETFYKDLNVAIDIVKASENMIILGDFNAKVGKGRCGGLWSWEQKRTWRSAC